MKNKKRLISFGIVLLVCTYLFVMISYYSLERNNDGKIIFFELWGILTIGSILLGCSEAMFLKAEIVPKLIRYIIFWQWIQVPIVLIITLIYAISHSVILV